MKELPYFKFNCSEWISGSITLEDLQTQGAFINICAYYWFKSGCLTLTEIKRRVNLKQATIEKLCACGAIKLDNDTIKISFLDEQFEERGHKSEINRINGSKGGAPKGNKNAIKINRVLDLNQPKSTNIEEEKEEEQDKNKNIKILGIKSEYFITIIPNELHTQKYKVFGKDGLSELFQELPGGGKLNYPEHADKFMRSRTGKQFNSIMHVWNDYNNKFIQSIYK